MARKPRVWYPGACYHIMCRGNHRHNIFRDDEDREVYLYVLRQVIDAKPFILLSYCLMTNHVHLQMETVDLAPGIIMKMLNQKYAIYFNRKYRFVGQLMQGRFQAEIIDTDRYQLEISRYIHLNPVKARMVPLPEEHKWSSYEEYLVGNPNGLCQPEKILQYFSPPKIKRYREFVEAGLRWHTTPVDVPVNLLLDVGEEDDPAAEQNREQPANPAEQPNWAEG
ncbi:MAG: transposase [Heliobacteriaceae bacterium]|nr:transposase [Heliobacteriaceae bacterium]MDD4588761.1 transposase [Heliobacteriaceae bacterium]